MRKKERLKFILNENNFFSSLFFLLFSPFFLFKDTHFYFFEKHYYLSTFSGRSSSLKTSSNNLSSPKLPDSDEKESERKEEETINFNPNKLIDSLCNKGNDNKREGDSFLERNNKEEKKQIYFFLKKLYENIEIENTFLVVYDESEEIHSTNLDALLIILENTFFFSYFSFLLRKLFSFSFSFKNNFEKFFILINNLPFHFSISPSLSSQNRMLMEGGEEKIKSREYVKEREKKERVWLERKLLTKHLFSNLVLFLLIFYVLLLNINSVGTPTLPSSIKVIGLVTGKSYFNKKKEKKII